MKPRYCRIAAIDIGSNTVHMVIMDLVGSRPPAHRSSESVILKLGAIVMENKGLPPSVFKKLRHTLKRLIRVAKKDGAAHVLVGATQAIRTLSNSEKVLDRLSEELHVPIHLLSGEREAELVLSTQIHGDPPTAFEVARLMIPIIQALRAAPDKAAPHSALLTGGTAHHLLAVAKANPTRLTRHDLEKAIKRLLKKSARKIAKKFDMEVERARLLVPGALLVTALLDHYSLDHLRITQRGLRDGMGMAYMRKGLEWWK